MWNPILCHIPRFSKIYRKRFHCARKAFDKVPHNLLMQKIRRIDGINWNIVSWIQSFLAHTSHRVAVWVTLSPDLSVTSGVPQGSVLGPTLFLLYMNELTKVVICGVSLYADDTLLYSEVNNDGDRLCFQANINSLHAWSSEWKMSVDTDKCVVITFGKGPTAAPQYSLECVDQTA